MLGYKYNIIIIVISYRWGRMKSPNEVLVYIIMKCDKITPKETTTLKGYNGYYSKINRRDISRYIPVHRDNVISV